MIRVENDKMKRRVNWQVCEYCGYRSGKNKIFQKHHAVCKVKNESYDFKESTTIPQLVAIIKAQGR